MLVLGRKVGEEIQIGRDISIRLLSIKGNRIRLGIEAPPSVSIIRSELSFFEETVKRSAPEAEREVCIAL